MSKIDMSMQALKKVTYIHLGVTLYLRINKFGRASRLMKHPASTNINLNYLCN